MNPPNQPLQACDSHDDWDSIWSGIAASSELSPATHYRCNLMLEALRACQGSGVERLLELGCGTGNTSEILVSEFPTAGFLGLDLSRTGVEASSRRVPGGTFLVRDLLEPPPADHVPGFGASHAVCMEVLEHLDQPVQFLRNAAAYMAPGCRLLVTVPGGPMNAFYRRIGHRRHFRPAEIAAVVQEAGYRVDRAWSSGFPFFDLYRVLLVMRGDKLIADVSGPPKLTTRIGKRLFDALFRFNSGRRGFQTWVLATWPGSSLR